MFKLKKFFSYFLIAIIALFAIGCTNDDGEDKNGDDDNNTPIPLDTRYTDQLKLEENYEGRDFINDGIGEVSLNRSVDGDTISVYTGGSSITIRFLGINTPESTGKVDAWGKAASAFVKEKLSDATSIVLEAEGDRKDSTNKRYLAWVWYKPSDSNDYRLLNLEEVELAYTKYLMDSDSKYFETLYDANQKAGKSKKRIWGEKDPNFNYSREIVQSNLLYMLNNHEEFQSGTKFEITVQLIRTNGNNLYLQDAYEVEYDDDGQIVSGKGAIYAFSGYNLSYYRYYNIGDIFKVQCQLEFGGQFGTQLTGLDNAGAVIENIEPVLREFDANELNGGTDLAPYYGSVVKVNNLEITSFKQKATTSGETYYVVEAKNNKGNKFDIYFGNSLITQHNVLETFKVGDKYNIVGGVAFYEYANGEYQISVGDAVRYSNGVMEPNDAFRVNDVVKVN